MTIKRIIGGNEIEIELTSMEMLDAYEAVQFENDRENCEDKIDGASAEYVQKACGVTVEQFESLLDSMAKRKRKYMDDYGIGWAEARDEAIADVIREWKEANA